MRQLEVHLLTRPRNRQRVLPWLALFGALQSPAFAQQRPDAGTLQPQQQQLPTLPPTGAPEVKSPAVKRAYLGGDIKLTPADVRFSGNTLIGSDELKAVVAGIVGKEVDLNRLVDAADAVRRVYAAKGYILTDVYLPEQQFATSGGTVEFAVVEARIGKVGVRVAAGSGIGEAYASAIANTYLASGDLVSQYLIDRPVLLLRDLPGTDAEASVSPGGRTGEVDVVISVSPRGKGLEPSVSLDNMGARSSGPIRVAGNLNINNPLTAGDALTLRLQEADLSGNSLMRVAYSFAAGGLGTKFNASYTGSEYKLGQQFASLGASGSGVVSSLGIVQPIVRGRLGNLFVSLGYDDKKLKDKNAQAGTDLSKSIALTRLSLLGNRSDGLFAGGTTSGALTFSSGRLSMDPKSLSLDEGIPVAFGARTAGTFDKVGIEVQRAQYLSAASSLLINLAAQTASKNLASAEKFSLGGPQGVRGYPVGEGIGDEGNLVSVEYRYLTGWPLFGQVVTLSAFYDSGSVKRDRVRNASTLNAVTTANTVSLSAAGIGALLGREGDFVFTVHLASRTSNQLPTTGDPDERLRVWAQFQKWF